LISETYAVCDKAIAGEKTNRKTITLAIARRVRPSFGTVSYAELKSGTIRIDGINVRTAPIASIYRSEQVAEILKSWILAGEFTLTEPVAFLDSDRTFISQD